MMLRSLPLVLLFGLAIASLDVGRFNVISRPHLEAPHPWIYRGRASPQQPVEFTLLLKQKNLDVLAQIFRDVSDPASPKWGQFLTKKELDNIVRPDEAVFQKFIDWMRPYEQYIQLTVRADSIKVFTNVATASQLLQTPFHVYSNPNNGKKLTRIVGTASVPNHLEEYLDLVVGISEFLTPKQESVSYSLFGNTDKTTRKAAPRRDIVVTPNVLKNYYKVPLNLVATNSTTYQGIAAFNDYFSMGALRSFEADQKLAQTNVTRVGPDCSPTCDEYESDLDIQYITAMAQNANTIFINQAANYWILQFVDEVLSELDPPPQVFSISYGWAELEQCDIATTNCNKFGYNSQQYVQRTNTEFQKLGSLGVSVLVSDGDDGAPSLGGASGNCPLDPSHYCPVGGCNHTSSACGSITIAQGNSLCFLPMGIGSSTCQPMLQDNNLEAALNQFAETNMNCEWNIEQDVEGNPHLYSTCQCQQLKSVNSNGYSISGYQFDSSKGPVFTADYPTSSPYVTAVGATQFDVGSGNQIKGEVACSILTGGAITTGGGFSSFQSMPDYQVKAVSSYLSGGNNLPPSFSFNPKMRGYPDISFNGHNYKIFYSNDSTDSCPCLATAVDGTSCSAPALAGLISLLNDQLLNHNKSPLGFLNYLLYQLHDSNPSVFFDVEGGNNKCSRAYCCQYGYEAGKGWDPVVGLGTPNFQNLMQQVMKLKGVSQN